MQTTFLKIRAFVLLFALMGAGCEKDEIQYADESIQISSLPGISIYKTNGDYYNNISVQVLSTGQLNAIPDYTLTDPRIKVDASGKITPNSKWRLKSGYIVDLESYSDKVFTNITFQEYIDYNTKNQVACWPNNLIEPRIIDKNPFIEFYYYSGLNKNERVFTIGEINAMLENETLKTVFEKLK